MDEILEKCPQSIREIYISEMKQRRLNDNFLLLTPRKGKAVDGEINETQPSLALVEKAKANELLSAWYAFHEKAHHRKYVDLYSKVLYCKQLTADAIDPDTFLQLIADREFLFFEYSESYTSLEYPSLSHIVEAYDAEVNSRGRESVDRVLEQAFVPTEVHASDYGSWQRNLRELLQARKQRKRHMAELAELPEAFQVNIAQSQQDTQLSELETQLSKLFRAYLDARNAIGFCVNSNEKAWEKSHWEAAIHCVMTYLQENPSNIPGRSELVFFHLFTQQSKKLAEGTLNKYTFGKPKSEKTESVPQDRTKVNIRNQILLYDQILELFIMWNFPAENDIQADQYRLDAKFVFYHYTCTGYYSRYWHYDLRKFGERSHEPHIHFMYTENYRDGVDHFGNLLRFHINYCMPNQAQWLTPVLSHNKRETPLSILTTFFLAEANHGGLAKNWLPSRIKSLMKSAVGKNILETYEQNYGHDDIIRSYLTEWVKEHDLRVPHEEALLYEGHNSKVIAQSCGKYALEYALRDCLIQQGKEALERIAAAYFSELCFGDFSYDTFF